MASPWQRERISWPLTPRQLEDIDTAFEDIYAFLRQSPLGTSDQAFDFSELADPGILFLDSNEDLDSLATVGSVYINASGEPASLSAALGNVLISGGVGAVPSFGKVDLTLHVTGILPVANGGSGTSTVFTQGSVIFAGASGIYTQDNAGLFFDATNDRLGIGVASPTNALDVRGSSTIVGVYNSSSSAFAAVRFFEGSTLASSVQGIASNFGTPGRRSDLELVTLSSAGDITFRPNDTEVLRADSSTVTIPSGKTLTLAGIAIGSVMFAGTGGIVTGDGSGFFYDNTNNYLGLGTSSPGGTLDLTGTFTLDQAFAFRATGIHNTATAGTVYGAQFNTRVGITSGTQPAVQTFFIQSYYQGTGTGITSQVSVFARTAMAGVSPSGTITNARVHEIDSIANQATGAPTVTFTNAVGVFIRNQGAGTGSGGLTVTNAAGLAIGDQTGPAGNLANVLVGTLSIPTGSWSIYNSSTKNNHVAGPTYVGHTSTWGSGTNFISFADGTLPGTPASNTAAIYADDVGGTVEMFGINEASVTTQLTGLAIRKTADESVTNSTTQQADDHLTVNLAASSAYEFEIWGFWTTAGAVAGIAVQLDGTAGVSSLKADIAIIDNATNAFSAYTRVTAFNSPVGAGLTGDHSFFIKGVIEVSTAGTLFLEWAQNAADVVNATTLQENSYMVLRKLNA